jgi:hypothetical protein
MSKEDRPSVAEECRQRARDAERLADAAQTEEEKQFHLEAAKHWWEMADRAEINSRQ